MFVNSCALLLLGKHIEDDDDDDVDDDEKL
jgi:hypothetical protein